MREVNTLSSQRNINNSPSAQVKPNPKISVVMICYNHAKYISEAIESILNQTYHDFELIIVDDGSTDNTFKIIQGYEDPRITILTQKNSGPSIALNAGIDKSHGEFIAFMSGDDVSFPDRLMSQSMQIESEKADILFCLPEIIGPNSETLGGEVCPWFFGKEFVSMAELYRILFFTGNFLCAPSGFFRRTAIEKVGRFKRGLIQLQDFDYWIRACKKKPIIKVLKTPLIKYRYLYGLNLSDRSNRNRVRVETMAIYRDFFNDLPLGLLQEAFGDHITPDPNIDHLDVEIDKSILLLNHPDPIVQAIGAERIVRQLENDETYERLMLRRSFVMTNYFQITNSINLDDFYDKSKPKKLYRSVRNFIIDFLNIGITKGPIWTETQVKRNIQSYLEHGDYRKAVTLTRGIKLLHPESTMIGTLRKIIYKTWGILVNILAKINAFAEKIIKTQDVEVLPLARMYDYCKQANLITHEDLPEHVYINRPKVIGIGSRNLAEGEAFCPKAYVSILDDAIVTGGSSLVISHEGILLNDEMVDFEGEAYGIKSPHVWFRYKDKVILEYKKHPRATIKEGILLSCDHDFNYFHWLIECLPKLFLIDSLKQFADAPLIIPKGLHKNLEAALNKININDRRLIRLDGGVAYHVNRLIFPSALSRVVDRYMGEVVFNADIVLSHKWISKVGDQLKAGTQNKKKTWRKLFLTRRKGLRSLGNTEELEHMFLEYEFEILALDDVSLEFQIELFSQAAIVVAPTGAALTNMLLCQPGTKVLIFMSNHEISNYYFWSQLGDIAGLDVKIIAGERLHNLTNYYSVHDDFTIDPKIVPEEIGNFT